MRTEQRAKPSVLVVGSGPVAEHASLLLDHDAVHVRRVAEFPSRIGEPVDLVLVFASAREFPPCARIKESHPHFLPVMVVLPKQANTSRSEVLQAGADDVLTGLPEPEEFRLRVESWLRIKRTHDSLRRDAPATRDTRPPPQQSEAAPATRITMHGLIETRLRAEHARALRYREPLAFAFFSVDDAMHLLQRFGNAAVDKMAWAVRERMQGCFREGDEICRVDTLGFGVILPRAHFEGALAVATRAHKRVTGSYEIGNQSTRVSLSVGVSLFPSPRVRSYRELGTVAQLGASEALAAGGNRICVVQQTGYMYEPTGR